MRFSGDEMPDPRSRGHSPEAVRIRHTHRDAPVNLGEVTEWGYHTNG